MKTKVKMTSSDVLSIATGVAAVLTLGYVIYVLQEAVVSNERLIRVLMTQ